MAKFVVSPTARRGHRSIGSALLAASASGRAAVVEVEPGHYREQLTIRGEVALVARGPVVVDWPHGRAVDAIGAVRLAGFVVVGREGDAVDCGGGTLTIENSRIQAGGGGAVYARAGTSVTLRDSAVDRGHVVFAGSTGLVERCRFTAAATNAIAVVEGADVRIEGSRVDGAGIHGVRVSGARARIADCDLTGTVQAAVVADSSAEIAVENCRITAVHGPGVSVVEQSRGTVEDTRVTDAEHGIVVATGADPLVRRCVFTDCRGSGINVHQNGRGRFEDVEVVDSGDIAVYSTTGGAPDVRGCRVTGGNVGVVVQDARGTFTGIDVEDLASSGLRLLGSATATFSRITVSLPQRPGLERRREGPVGRRGVPRHRPGRGDRARDVADHAGELVGGAREGRARGRRGRVPGRARLPGRGGGARRGHRVRRWAADRDRPDRHRSVRLRRLRPGLRLPERRGLRLHRHHDRGRQPGRLVRRHAGALLGHGDAGRRRAGQRQAPPDRPAVDAAGGRAHPGARPARAAGDDQQLPRPGLQRRGQRSADRVEQQLGDPEPDGCAVIEGENVADTVNNYDGPVFNAEVSGTQLAWNSTNVTQNQQQNTDAVAPGFEELAAVVADVLRRLPQSGLSPEDREDAEAVAGEVLAEITSPEPEKGKVRRALAMLRNLLAPVATGAVAGVAAGTQEWAQAAISGLGS